MLSFTYSFLFAQAKDTKTLKVDSIYGFRDIKLETSYSSLKNTLSKKEILTKHEYACFVIDSAYLKIKTLKIEKINFYFFDDKVRDINIDVKDSINVTGVLEELKKTYGLINYTNDYDQNAWLGKKCSLNYTIDHENKWGVVSLRSKNMECYVCKILKDNYWEGDKGSVIRCPRIDPCDE